MNEKEQTIAKVLEIAITLTGAKHDWLYTDEYNNLIIRNPLYITMKRVLQIMTDESLLDVDKKCKVSCGPSVIQNKPCADG